MFGSFGSTTVVNPSPPVVMYQSALTMPCTVFVRDGPPTVLLSCVPPYTW